jgi:hypothetical protein
MQGTEIDIPEGGSPPTTLTANGRNFSGIATLFGQFSFNFQLTVTLATATATGSGTLITTNGEIYTTIVGSLETTTTPGISSITEIDTITGGTGRFTGAKGFFILERLANPAPPGTGLTSGSFHGTIALPE